MRGGRRRGERGGGRHLVVASVVVDALRRCAGEGVRLAEGIGELNVRVGLRWCVKCALEHTHLLALLRIAVGQTVLIATRLRALLRYYPLGEALLRRGVAISRRRVLSKW